ncbi:hypothetical protein [Burkholderia sp. Ac-20365]|uniref:hypothetical protein n=1 Tax=Burkholderia sp. Ac-20365 TaxID=2703897 RepID=UPI00197BE23F|nr:hypothetical protein [Burkholderia sp. Ac-20365]MBN3763266.1 hypothetical protein [Burkholderia sp. Ac-20365]
MKTCLKRLSWPRPATSFRFNKIEQRAGSDVATTHRTRFQRQMAHQGHSTKLDRADHSRNLTSIQVLFVQRQALTSMTLRAPCAGVPFVPDNDVSVGCRLIDVKS